MPTRIPRYITATCPYCDGALIEARDNLDDARVEHGWVAYAPHVHGPLLVRFRCEHGHRGELHGTFIAGEMQWRLSREDG
jgi:hypothetical protein